MKTFSDLYEKTLNVAQRRKQGLRMKVLARSSAFQMKKKRSLMRIRDTAKLTLVAKKKIVQKFRDKYYPDYKTMPLQQRVIVDQRLQQKHGAKMAKMLKKAVAVLKKGELERVKQARAAMVDK